jgi:hypothetical protein
LLERAHTSIANTLSLSMILASWRLVLVVICENGLRSCAVFVVLYDEIFGFLQLLERYEDVCKLLNIIINNTKFTDEKINLGFYVFYLPQSKHILVYEILSFYCKASFAYLTSGKTTDKL